MRGYHIKCQREWLTSLFFFFSSRRRHTRFKCDWSSDVCSSDLTTVSNVGLKVSAILRFDPSQGTADTFNPTFETVVHNRHLVWPDSLALGKDGRSEERRVGKECRSRWSPYH